MSDRPPPRLQIVTLGVIAGVSGLAALIALGFPARARVYPLTVSVAALVLAVWEGIRLGHDQTVDPIPPAAPLLNDVRHAIPYLVWGIGFYVLTWFVGLVPASLVFVTLFLHRHGEVHWPQAVAAGAAVATGLIGLGLWLDLRWPRSVIDLLYLIGLA